MLRALLFIPAHDPELRRWLPVLWRYCLAHRYRPEAVVHDWCDVLKLWVPGMRVVVARRDHASWLEVVSEESGQPPNVRQRRPRLTAGAED